MHCLRGSNTSKKRQSKPHRQTTTQANLQDLAMIRVEANAKPRSRTSTPIPKDGHSQPVSRDPELSSEIVHLRNIQAGKPTHPERHRKPAAKTRIVKETRDHKRLQAQWRVMPGNPPGDTHQISTIAPRVATNLRDTLRERLQIRVIKATSVERQFYKKEYDEDADK